MMLCVAGQAKVIYDSAEHRYSLDSVLKCSEQEAREIKQLKEQAKLQWGKPGHPGWFIVPAPGQQGFLNSQGWAKGLQVRWLCHCISILVCDDICMSVCVWT